MPTTKNRSIVRCAMTGALCALLIGCAGGEKTAQTDAAASRPDERPTTNDLDARTADALERIAQMTDAQRADREAEPIIARGPSARANAGPSFDVAGEDPSPTVSASPGGRSGEVIDETFASPMRSLEPTLTLEQQRADLIAKLAANLRAQADRDVSPLPSLARLAALEILQPGILNSTFVGVQGAGGPLVLPDEDLAFVTTWRDLMNEAGLRLDATGDTASLAGLLENAALETRDMRPLDLPAAVLATRVDGFGVYKQMPTYDPDPIIAEQMGGVDEDERVYKLLAGRRHRVIVYVEVAHFARRSIARDGVRGHEVQLTQELALYHAGEDGDLLAWRKPDQTITDFSRNPRRDFYIVQVIELPETLTVGKYALKVTVRDAVREAVSERIIPIDVVADANALR
ncbi:MAG: hypothetical protein AAGD00_09795 [Planctomycetota bacterium]